jgi:hypothetical protein
MGLRGCTTPAYGSRVSTSPYEIGTGRLTERPPQRGLAAVDVGTQVMWIDQEFCHPFDLTRGRMWSTDTLFETP